MTLTSRKGLYPIQNKACQHHADRLPFSLTEPKSYT